MTAPHTGQEKPLPTYLDREALLLAPYAMHSRDSAGRKHPELDHPYRSPYQRDRDRILHSSAYRRLSGKTQVFTGVMGDYHRTRLTHTQEVASIARTIGRVLGLNEDLIEALALFHDIGHPPFGHAGEDVINELLHDHGGFSHNRFGLTIAEDLEVRCQEYRGLNLTREVLDGQKTRTDKQADWKPLLEVQLVDAADSVTYDAHDTDDAVKLGLVTLDEIRQIPLVRRAWEAVRPRFNADDHDLVRKAIVHELVDLQVSDLVETAHRYLSAAEFRSADEARQASFRISTGPELTAQKAELERFLYQRVYRHPDVVAVRLRAQQRLREMFHGYLARPELLPKRYQLRAQRVGLHRMIGEYLAGMTDHFCDAVYEQHFRRTNA